MDIVIFRVLNGEVMAVLPDESANYGCFMSYMHIGQHSECSNDLASYTRPATEDEYVDLYAELIDIGYEVHAMPFADFLFTYGKANKIGINYSEYDYADQRYSLGWNSALNLKTQAVFGWMIFAMGRVSCPDCHGMGSFRDSTSGYPFNRPCGLCKS